MARVWGGPLPTAAQYLPHQVPLARCSSHDSSHSSGHTALQRHGRRRHGTGDGGWRGGRQRRALQCVHASCLCPQHSELPFYGHNCRHR